MGSNNSPINYWYLIYSKPKQEITAKENLKRQGYNVYLPMMHSRRRRRHAIVSVVEPMFPRYLFISLNKNSDNWSPINSTTGVVGMVKFGNQAAWIPHCLIDAIKSNEDQHGIQKQANLDYQQGDKVRIINGSFEGQEGVCYSKSANQRVTILLKLAGKLIKTRLHEVDIELAY